MPKQVIDGDKIKMVITEVSAVDRPAQEGALIALAKRYKEANRACPPRILLKNKYPEIAKALDISAHLYVWDICCDWDIEWAISRISEVADEDLPFIAKYIASRAETLGLTDMLPTDGVFAELVAKSKSTGKPTSKEVDMTPEEVQKLKKEHEDALAAVAKERDELKAKLEKAETATPDEPEGETVYKAADGKEYKGEVAEVMKQLDAEKADRKLEKAASEFAHLPGTLDERKALVKSLNSIEDEKIREKYLGLFKSTDSEMAKFFKAAGDAGDVKKDDADPAKKLDELISKYQAENKDAGYDEARRVVKSQNPELVKELATEEV